MGDSRFESTGNDGLDAAIAEWIEAIEQGKSSNPEEFVARYPQFASGLRSFIADYDHFRQVARDSLGADVPSASSPRQAFGTEKSPAEQRTILESDSTNGIETPQYETLGSYEVVNEIARGGMGIVFKARDTQLSREIAIKVLRDGVESQLNLKQRFVEEAQIAGQLQHPGITPVYELGEFSDQRPYFTMKLVKGETLASLLGQRPSPDHDRHRFLKIFEHVCQTVAYAHSHKVIHRDLKPANIMVGAFGEVQVMDWGLAKVLTAATTQQLPKEGDSIVRTVRSSQPVDLDTSDSKTQVGSVLGTWSYMPPEQAMGEVNEVDERADVFGLGAILCEILTGRPPYVAASSDQLRRKAIRGDLAEAFDLLNHCGADHELIDLALKSLAPEPVDRPSDAGAMAQALTEYLSGVETRLHQAELAEAQAVTRATAERHRRRLTLAFSGAVLAVLVIGVVGTTWGLVRAAAALRAESQAKDDLRRELYVADLQLANQIWESGNGSASTVANLLDGHSPKSGQIDLRDFAWRLQWTAIHKNSRILKGHIRGAKCVAIAPDGSIVTLDGEITLRRFAPSMQHASVESPLRDVASHFSCSSISDDAKWVAIGLGNSVSVFDVSTGLVRHTLGGRALAKGLSFSSDSRRLAIVWGDGGVQIQDIAKSENSVIFQVLHPDRIARLKQLSLAYDGNHVFLTDYPRSKQISSLSAEGESLIANDHESSIYSVALTSDGRLGATADSNGQVCVWDATTRQALGPGFKVHRGQITALEFSPDGNRLATGAFDGVVTVWDVATREQIVSLVGHLGQVNSLRFSADGSSLSSASEDGHARVWSLVPSDQLRVFASHELPLFSVAYSPDGNSIAIGTGNDLDSPGAVVKIWNIGSRKLTSDFRIAQGRALALVFVPDARGTRESSRLATGGYDSFVRIWDSVTGTEILAFPGLSNDPSMDSLQKVIGTLAVSPNRKVIVAGFGHPTYHLSDYQQVAKVWDLATGDELATLRGHVNTICSVAFSRDGKLLATASDDHRVKLWSADNWKREPKTLVGTERLKSVTFSPDNRWVVAGGVSGSVTIWDVAGGDVVKRLYGHANAVQGLAFSPDGRTLASASWDNTIKLWEPVSGRETRTLREHKDWITCLAFSPDGTTLPTGSFDSTVRFWEAALGESIAAFVAEDRILADRTEQRRRDELDERSHRKALPRTALQLEACSGTYENGLSVSAESDHLKIWPIEGEGGSSIELYPQSEIDFFARTRNLDVRFLKDETGQVARVLICLNGRTLEARRALSSAVK